MDFFDLEHNAFLSGGLVLMLAGGVLYYLKRLPGTLYDFIERFFPTQSTLAREFASVIEERRFSMATLQDYLMLHRRDPEEAARRVGEIGALQVTSAPSDNSQADQRRNDPRDDRARRALSNGHV